MSCDYSRSPSLFSFFSCFVFKQILRSWSFLLITYKEQTIARVLQVPLPNDCLIIHRCSLISLGKSYAALPRYNLHVMNLPQAQFFSSLLGTPSPIFVVTTCTSPNSLFLHHMLSSRNASDFRNFHSGYFNGSLVQIHRTKGCNLFPFHFSFVSRGSLLFLGHV